MVGVRTKGDANKRGLEKGGNTAPCALHVLTKDVRVLGVFPFLFWRFSGGPLGRTTAKPPRYSFTGTIAHKAPEA